MVFNSELQLLVYIGEAQFIVLNKFYQYHFSKESYYSYRMSVK